MRLNVRATNVFFDGAKILEHMDAKQAKVLARTGAFAQRVMRNSIKKAPKGKKTRQKAKATGKYPRYHAHKNSGLRLILFSYDPIQGSVVVGPYKFGTPEAFSEFYRGRRTITTSDKTVPQLLNEGGVAKQTTEYRSGTVVNRQMNYRPRPFADDALEPATEKFKDLMLKVRF